MIEEIKKYMEKNFLGQEEMAKLLECSPSLLSGVLNGKVKPSKNFQKSFIILENKGKSTLINGNGHHIDIHHAICAEEQEEYSPAINMIVDVIKEWPESRRRKLAAKVVMMNGEEKLEEG